MLDELLASLRTTVRPPSCDPPGTCLEWATDNRGPLLVIAGQRETRDIVFQQVGAIHIEAKTSWEELLFTGHLADYLSKIRAKGSLIPHEWDLIWNLITLDEVYLDDTLQDLVAQSTLVKRMYRALLEARHRLEENIEVRPVVQALGKWLIEGQVESVYDQTLLGMKGPNKMPAPYERFDALLFLATLASFNALLDPTILVLDNLDGILGHTHRKGLAKELVDLCIAIDRWARLGCPIKFIFGLGTDATVAQLGKVYAPLEACLNNRLCLV